MVGPVSPVVHCGYTWGERRSMGGAPVRRLLPSALVAVSLLVATTGVGLCPGAAADVAACTQPGVTPGPLLPGRTSLRVALPEPLAGSGLPNSAFTVEQGG